MKKILVLSAILSSGCLWGQNLDIADSLSVEICKSILMSKERNDSIRISQAFKDHENSDIQKFAAGERDSIGKKIYYRLYKNCPIFKEILVRNSPKNEYWQTVNERPESKLTGKECSDFFQYTNFIYFEASGDTAHLQIINGIWTDNFKDGTYSKLKLIRGADCQFEIEFIESNNSIRKNFSNPGDKYKYTILDKHENHYLMSVEMNGTTGYSLFKLYY